MAGDSDPRYDPWAGFQRPSMTSDLSKLKEELSEIKYDDADFHRRMNEAHHVLPKLLLDGWVIKSLHVVSNHRVNSNIDGSQEQAGGAVGYVLLERPTT